MLFRSGPLTGPDGPLEEKPPRAAAKADGQRPEETAMNRQQISESIAQLREQMKLPNVKPDDQTERLKDRMLERLAEKAPDIAADLRTGKRGNGRA